MRRLSIAIVVLSLVALLLSSCASFVTVRHLVPAEISLDGRRDLAVASVQVSASAKAPRYWVEGLEDTNFSLATGWENTLVQNLSEYATADLFSALSATHYFSLTPPAVTDRNINQMCRSNQSGCAFLGGSEVNGLLFADITYLDATERVVGRDIFQDISTDDGVQVKVEKVQVGRDYLLVQRVTLSITYTIYDPSSGKLLVSRSYTDALETETKIGQRLYHKGEGGVISYRDELTYLRNVAPSLLSSYKSLVAAMSKDFVGQLAPAWKSERISLKKIKPKSPLSKDAQTAVDEKNYRRAQNLYHQIWLDEGSSAAGYNAALLLEVMGEFDQALALIDRVYRQTGSSDAYQALLRIQEAKSQHEKAQRQMAGEEISDGLITQFQYTVVE